LLLRLQPLLLLVLLLVLLLLLVVLHLVWDEGVGGDKRDAMRAWRTVLAATAPGKAAARHCCHTVAGTASSLENQGGDCAGTGAGSAAEERKINRSRFRF